MSNDLKIILEDVKEKFDTVIEGIQMISEKLDRHIDKNQKEHEKFEMGLLESRRDLNEHRNNTELIVGGEEEKSPDFDVQLATIRVST
jgi:hypothetical protein